MQLIDDRRLADAGISGHQYQLRYSAGDDTLESAEQRFDFPLTAVQHSTDRMADTGGQDW